MDIDDFTHYAASDYAKKKQIESALACFVSRVRSGDTINKYLLAFIADGVEAHLAGKKPWPAKRGAKSNKLAITFPYYYEYLKLKDRYKKRRSVHKISAHISVHEPSQYIYSKIIEEVSKSDGIEPPDERTVERYVKLAKEDLEGDKRRATTVMLFCMWCNFYEKKIPKQFQ